MIPYLLLPSSFWLILFCFDYYHRLLVVLFYDIRFSPLLFSVILTPFIILAICHRFYMKCMVDFLLVLFLFSVKFLVRFESDYQYCKFYSNRYHSLTE